MRIILSIIICSLMAIACKRPPEFPDAPSIDLKDMQYLTSNDSITVKINLYFKDGNGDLGVIDTDDSGPFKHLIDSTYDPNDTSKVPKKILKKYSRNYYNYWLDLFVKKDTSYILVQSPDTYHKYELNSTFLNGRFRPFSTENYLKANKPIEGMLSYDFAIRKVLDSNSYTIRPLLVAGDSIKFGITILDRQLNKSNTVYTPSIYIVNNQYE